MTTPDELDDAIAENAKGPKRAKGDSGEIEQHSLKDQIEAAKFIAARKAVAKPKLGLRQIKISPPGTV